MKKGNHSNRNRIEIYLFIYNNKTTKKITPKIIFHINRILFCGDAKYYCQNRKSSVEYEREYLCNKKKLT